jgi:hypothetical protein
MSVKSDIKHNGLWYLHFAFIFLFLVTMLTVDLNGCVFGMDNVTLSWTITITLLACGIFTSICLFIQYRKRWLIVVPILSLLYYLFNMLPAVLP